MIGDLVSLAADWFLMGGAAQGPRGRLRAYRKGDPVFVPAHFKGGFPWATELLCQGSRAWVVSNRGFETERRVEIKPRPDTITIDEAHTWSVSPSVTFESDGQTISVGSSSDHHLLFEAARAWKQSAP